MIRYERPLVEATLLRRYKRFLADIRFSDGREAVAHCGNPGSMAGLAEPGSVIYLSENTNPKAKLDWRWEIASQAVPAAGGANQAFVGINTNLANRVVEAALKSKQIAELSGYDTIRREVRYADNSRIDFLLSQDDKPDLYLEVKSVTLRRPEGPAPEAAEFPDAVTARGTKHMAALAKMIQEGHRAMLLYLVQRSDCTYFTLAADIDPAYAAAVDKARQDGVALLCYSCSVSPDGIELIAPLEVRL